MNEESNSVRTPSRVTLTADQSRLVKAALSQRASDGSVTPEQRRTIREVCSLVGTTYGPEQILIAFKAALIDAAKDERIPAGSERNALLGRLVTVFIGELYSSGVGASDNRAQHLRGEDPSAAPIPGRGNQEEDSPDAHP